MKLVIHDLPAFYSERFQGEGVTVLEADGRYAPCQGRFGCWEKTPGQCVLKDRLQDFPTLIGKCDQLVFISRNTYGSYSPAVKGLLDRSIGSSLPFSTYRGGQMHHVCRYPVVGHLQVFAYGDITEAEEQTFRRLTQRNALNFACKTWAFRALTQEELEALVL